MNPLTGTFTDRLMYGWAMMAPPLWIPPDLSMCTPGVQAQFLLTNCYWSG